MLTTVNGIPGMGKTLYAVLKAIESPMPIVSNITLKFDYEKLSLSKLINMEYTNCFLLLDEAYKYFDSRLSGSELNVVLSAISFQSRKMDLDIYTTEQLKNSIDLRWHTNSQLDVEALGYRKKAFHYRLVHKVNNVPQKIENKCLPLKTAEILFQYYDTKEIVKLLNYDEKRIKYFTHDERIQEEERIAHHLFDFFEGKPSLNDIKHYLHKNKFPQEWKEYIYTEIKILKKQQKEVGKSVDK